MALSSAEDKRAPDQSDMDRLVWKCPVGAIQLSEVIQDILVGKVRGGRAKSVVELVQEAVLRLVDEDEAYDDEIVRIALAGIADAEAGRYTTIATRQDGKNFIAQAMERARNIVAAET